MKTVALDLHDFSVANNRLDLMLRLRDHFPNFKVSMFMVPYDRQSNWGPTRIHRDNVKRIKENLDWIQIIPHGVTHEPSHEMEHYDYATFKHDALPKIQEAFARDGLPYEHGFCSPHWRSSDGVIKALDEMGWWGAVLREDRFLKPRRFYKYTHLLDENFWESDLPVLKLHGHVYGTKNDIGRCFDNLLKLPKDTIFTYVTDYIESK